MEVRLAVNAVQIKGVLPLPLSALRSTLPVFKNRTTIQEPDNRDKAVPLTAGQFRFAFGDAISAEESDALYDPFARSLRPGRPLFEAAAA